VCSCACVLLSARLSAPPSVAAELTTEYGHSHWQQEQKSDLTSPSSFVGSELIDAPTIVDVEEPIDDAQLQMEEVNSSAARRNCQHRRPYRCKTFAFDLTSP
jgi:hypothetical protein